MALHYSFNLLFPNMQTLATLNIFSYACWRPCDPHFAFGGVSIQTCLFNLILPWAAGIRDISFPDQISRSVMSDSLRPHESQHARPPCPSQTPGVHSDSRPSSQWCHPAISSSVVPFSSGPNPSQHQSLFQWVNSSHEVPKVLEFQPQYHCFQRNPRTDLL